MPRTAWLLLVLCACDDDVLSMQREDVGVRDTGIAMPLGLEAGMTFGYQTQLSQVGTGAMNAGNASYELQIIIQSVDDRGPGESRLSVTTSGANLIARDWTDDRDFDLWVARLGPSRGVDMIDPSPTNIALDGPPELPARVSTKNLPAPDTFFLDLRDIEAIRTAFTATHMDRRPRVVGPEMNNGLWLFAYDGDDPSVFFYPDAVKRRSIRLEYDPRGFLARMSEDVGAAAPDTPRANASLNLRTGP